MAKERNFGETDLIVIRGNLYSYWSWDDHLQMHKVEVVDIDEDGILTSTGIPEFFSEKEMEEGKEMELTYQQWVGLAKFFIRNSYFLEESECERGAEKVMEKFLLSPVPLVEELPKFVRTYFEKGE